MRWIWLPAMMAASLASMPSAAGPTDDLARLAKGFEDSVLRVGDDSARPGTIVRWDSTIAMAFVNPANAPRHDQLMRKAIREIASIAKLSVREVEPTDPAANFVGKFSDASAGVGMGGGTTNCFARLLWKNGRITRVAFNVGTRLGARSDRCVAHEVMHGFGFIAHPHGLDSVLSYVHNRAGLTSNDRLLIETLYDRRLQPGMARDQAASLACLILAEKTGVNGTDAAAVCANRGHVERQTPRPLSADQGRP